MRLLRTSVGTSLMRNHSINKQVLISQTRLKKSQSFSQRPSNVEEQLMTTLVNVKSRDGVITAVTGMPEASSTRRTSRACRHDTSKQEDVQPHNLVCTRNRRQGSINECHFEELHRRLRLVLTTPTPVKHQRPDRHSEMASSWRSCRTRTSTSRTSPIRG